MPIYKRTNDNQGRVQQTGGDFNRASGVVKDVLHIVTAAEEISKVIATGFRYDQGLNSLEIYLNGQLLRVKETILGTVYGDYTETTNFTVTFEAGVIHTGDQVRFRVTANSYDRSDNNNANLNQIAKDYYGRDVTTGLLKNNGAMFSSGLVHAIAYGTTIVAGYEYRHVQTLQDAITDIGSENKTVYVTGGDWLVDSNITFPANVGLRIENGSKFVVDSTAVVTINGPFEAGLYQVFDCEGKNIQGISITYPQWFGAIAGYNQSDTQRTLNTIAIQKAWDCVTILSDDIVNIPTPGVYSYEIWYGTLMIEGFFETNSDIVVGTSIIGGNGATKIKGNGSEQSCIWGFGSGNVIDAVGRRRLTIEGIKISSTTAKVGLLSGRIGGGQGSNLHLYGVDIVGNFSIASLVTIASEDIRGINCYFQNVFNGASVYASGPGPSLIGATSTQGTILTSTNSDIKFTNCTFFSNGPGLDVLRFDTYFDGSFTNCIILSGDGNSTNNLINLIASPVAFSGNLTFTNTLLEGNHVTLYYHSYPGGIDAINREWIDISFIGCTITLFNVGLPSSDPVYFKYKTLSTSTDRNLVMLSVKNANILYTDVYVNRLESCFIQLRGLDFNINEYINNSEIYVNNLIFATGARSIRSKITDTSYNLLTGSAPVLTNKTAIPTSHTAEHTLHGVLAGLYNIVIDPLPGEIFSIDNKNNSIPGASTGVGQLIPMFWTGYNYMSLGAVPGTPSSSTGTSGLKGTLLFDDNYFYICIKSGTTGVLNGGMTTGDINISSNTLEVSSSSGISENSFLNIAGVTGDKRVLNVSGSTITLDSTSDATVVGASISYVTPEWRRIAYNATW